MYDFDTIIYVFFFIFRCAEAYMRKVLGVVAPMRYDSGPRIMMRDMMRVMTHVMIRVMMQFHDARHDVAS
jgi:hypothetical protein